MQRGLAAAAVVPFVVAAAAHAQVRALQPTAPIVVSSHSSKFGLPPDAQYAPSTALQRGVIAEKDLAPNAVPSVGLTDMLGRSARSLRLDEGLAPVRNPGASLVLKF